MVVCYHDAIGVSAGIKVNRPHSKKQQTRCCYLSSHPDPNYSLFGFSVSHTSASSSLCFPRVFTATLGTLDFSLLYDQENNALHCTINKARVSHH